MNEEVLNYFDGDELAANAWLAKYALKDKNEVILEKNPDEMHHRAAREFARINKNYEVPISNEVLAKLSTYGKNRGDLTEEGIYNLLQGFKYLVLGGSINAMLGNKYQIGSMSNCFVVGQPTDSSNGIMAKRTDQFNLMKRRGGVGKDLSRIRPRGAKVNNAAKTSTGAASFMGVDSAITNEVAQDGRRGALMLSIDIRHPDSPEFIEKKQDLTQVTGANISVKIPDDFMEAVEKDEDYILRYPIDLDLSDLKQPVNGLEYNKLVDYSVGNSDKKGYIKKVRAKELWNRLIHCAWNTAEPGIMFEDTHHNYSPDGVYPQYKGVTTNPCGEIFMQPYDSCRLLHHVLTAYVIDPYTDHAVFDYKKFYENCYETMILGDNLVDLELEAIARIIHHIQESPDEYSDLELNLWKKVAVQTQSGRRVGIGFTGLADMAAMLGYSLNDSSFDKELKTILDTKMSAELNAGVDLAILRGPFIGYDRSKEMFYHNDSDILYGLNDFYSFVINNFPKESDRMYNYGRRNVSWSTVAPVGTGSLMTGTTSGIEPLFAPYYMRRKKCMTASDRVDYVDELGEKFTEFPVVHRQFAEWAKKQTITIERSGKIGEISNGEVRRPDLNNKADLDFLFANSPWFGSTADDITWERRVAIQAIVQFYTTHSISSTVNLPKDTTKELVSNIYMQAWESKLKGITVYRDGSRSGILVKNETPSDGRKAPARPKELKGVAYQTNIQGLPHSVVVGLLDNSPYEVFIFQGKYPEGEGVIIKKKKREYVFKIKDKEIPITEHMSDEQATITRLTSMSLRHGADIKFVVDQLKKSESIITSFTSGMARVLSKFTEKETGLKCPKCGGRLVKENGCEKCLDCGDSKCFFIRTV